MQGMNNTRILLGGLAAGVVILLGEFLTWGLLLENAYEGMLAATGLAEAPWAMVGYVSISLVLGVLLAWLYAAIRPRSGPGPWTAVRAGAALWVAAWVLPHVGNAAMGLSLGSGPMLISLSIALVEVCLAAAVAGWIYREKEQPAVAASPSF